MNLITSLSLFVALAMLLQPTISLYSSNDGVVELTSSNFENLVLNDTSVWVVEFYAPWCGFSKRLVPEYKKAAKLLKGRVKVGAVNDDENPSLGDLYGVQGFPTIKIFGADKQSPITYNGDNTAEDIVAAATQTV